MTTIAPPPKPQPSHEELEAVISCSPQGKLLLSGSEAALRRDGVLVRASWTGPAVHTPSGSLASALALAKALRPLR
jgi:hypothetical protein